MTTSESSVGTPPKRHKMSLLLASMVCIVGVTVTVLS